MLSSNLLLFYGLLDGPLPRLAPQGSGCKQTTQVVAVREEQAGSERHRKDLGDGVAGLHEAVPLGEPQLRLSWRLLRAEAASSCPYWKESLPLP